MQKIFWCCLLSVVLFSVSFAQSDSLARVNYRNRKLLVVSATAALAATSLVGLHEIWFSQYNTGEFHFFNDNQEWNQMDKCGHAFTNYQTSRLMMSAFEWAGFTEKQKLYVGGSVGFAYMTLVEIMDGYSEGWGFSWGDMVANLAGTTLAISQEAVWKQHRIVIKYSYARSGLAQYNPSLLGENQYSRLIKDYNAQTYWLSVNPSMFIKKKGSRFPKWLNLAIGYSAYGMLGARYNNVIAQDEDGTVYAMNRERRYYLSVDVDLTRIPCRSKALKALLSVVNILKFPAPALELSGTKFRFYGIYY
ncbi:MAG: DUF2279 domain-containing protein [bacterium]|nr:DUF2279 domain-containing protein [bacterium]